MRFSRKDVIPGEIGAAVYRLSKTPACKGVLCVLWRFRVKHGQA